MNTQTVWTQVEPSGLQTLMDNVIVSYGLKILGAIAVIVLLLLISKIVANVVRRNIIKNAPQGSKHIDKVWKLIHDIVFYILVIFSFFVGFEIVWFNVGLILWGISFGVWLAFKEILGNMIAGIMMLYTKEFKLGDIVEINADQVYFGRIEEITIRYTIIRTLDLRQVVLPNMTLISVPIKTFSSEDMIRLTAVFGVHYNSDLQKVIKVITDTVNACDFVKEKPTTKTFVSNFAASYIELKSMFSFDPKCWIINDVAIGTINEMISASFKLNNISCPYNILTLTFEDEAQKALLKQKLDTQNVDMWANIWTTPA